MEYLHSCGIPKHSNMCDHVHQHPAPGYQSISTERYVLRNYSALKQKMGQQKNNKFPVTFNLKNYSYFHLSTSPPISTKMIIRRIMCWNCDYVTCFFSVWNKKRIRIRRWAGCLLIFFSFWSLYWEINVFFNLQNRKIPLSIGSNLDRGN